MKCITNFHNAQKNTAYRYHANGTGFQILELHYQNVCCFSVLLLQLQCVRYLFLQKKIVIIKDRHNRD